MSDESPETWPLRPAHAAYTLQGLCLALSDVAREEGSTLSRRALLKVAGITTAAELVSGELAHWFGSRMGDDHDLLERLQDSGGES